MSVGEYDPEVTALIEQIRPMVGKMPVKYPRWISTPEGDLGSEWCSDCGYFKVRNLRRKDRKRRSDYILDGGWRTEEDHFCFCHACGVTLNVCLTDYGAEEAIRTFEECGFSTSRQHDAYELAELLDRVEYASHSGDNPDQRAAVVAIAKKFLADEPPSPQANLLGLSDAQVDAVLHLVESRLCIIWPKIGAREEFANLLRVLEPAPEEEPEICEACGEPLEDGDMVYWSADDTGHLHADCCGPERESYVGPDGAPLKDGEPIPEPFVYRDPRATTEGKDNG